MYRSEQYGGLFVCLFKGLSSKQEVGQPTEKDLLGFYFWQQVGSLDMQDLSFLVLLLLRGMERVTVLP